MPTTTTANPSYTTHALALPKFITELHGTTATDCGITFCKKFPELPKPKNFQVIGSVIVAELNDKWLALAPHIGNDTYFTLHSFYPRPTSKKPSPLTGLPKWNRHNHDTHTLTSFHLDIDCRERVGLSPEEAIPRLLAELDEKSIARPTWILHSGHKGFWAIWKMQPISGGHRHVHERIETRLAEMFTHLGSKVGDSTDVARVIRIPGSIHSESGRVVRVERISDTVVTLAQMAACLDVGAVKQALPGERPRNPNPNPHRQKGGRERWARQRRGLLALEKLRNGFREGTRHHAVLLCGLLEHYVGHRGEKEIQSAMTKMAERCRPPLTAEDVHKQWRSVNKLRKLRERWLTHARMVDMLNVTHEELASLTDDWFRRRPAEGILTKLEFTPAQQAVLWTGKSAKRNAIERRCGLIRAMLTAQPNLSIRKLQSLIAKRHGLKVSRGTVESDVRAIRAVQKSAAVVGVQKRPAVVGKKTGVSRNRSAVLLSSLYTTSTATAARKLDTRKWTPEQLYGKKEP